VPTVGAASDELGQTRFEELVPRAIAGERQAWETLVARLQRVAWRSIAGFDLGDEDRKDAFAATFFRLNERLSTIREPAKLPGWVATTARNEVHTLLRARRRLRTTDPHDLPLVPQPAVSDEGLMDDELHGAVRLGFASLSARCQELLRLVTLDPPLSYAEIGDLLDMPHGSIGPTRQRCLDQLRGTAALRPFIAGR
jgi:RNA polymerase sigma factor (sigma-70 family)